jgi:predicted XRE-type DNA-binding protein
MNIIEKRNSDNAQRIKIFLSDQIRERQVDSGLTQTQFTVKISIDKYRMSRIIAGNVYGISYDVLINAANNAGAHFDIAVVKKPISRSVRSVLISRSN